MPRSYGAMSEICAMVRQRKQPHWLGGPLPSLEMVVEGNAFASPDVLRFRHPESFVAGNLSTCFDQWVQISCGYDKREFELAIIKDGVDIFDLFTPFKGTFLNRFENTRVDVFVDS